MENPLMRDLREQQTDSIILKEYGRNTQNIVNYILTIQDDAKRAQYAKTLIELMKQINPSMRDAQDSYHKLWDHLYIMSNLKLEVDSPYPRPEMSIFDKKPMRVDYNTHNLYFKHYGRNIELLIKKAIELTGEDQEAAIIYVGKLMKRFYGSWNKENIDDAVIVEHLERMSNNKLRISVEKVKSENLFDSQKEYREYKSGGNGHGHGGHDRRNKNRNKPQDKRRRQ